MIPIGLLPAGQEQQAFIAGGWAACPALATDMDVWVTVEDVDYARDRLLAHFKGLSTFRVTVEDLVSERPAYIPDSGNFLTRKVAQLTNRVSGFKIHVLVTTGRVEDVLGAFDISTHQVAVLPNGQVVRGPYFTTVNQPPLVIREGGPQTTVRLEKITKRYAPMREYLGGKRLTRVPLHSGDDLLRNAR